MNIVKVLMCDCLSFTDMWKQGSSAEHDDDAWLKPLKRATKQDVVPAAVSMAPEGSS